MTRIDFAKGVAYLTAGCGHSLTREQTEVYFDCLGDLDSEVFALAAKRVLLTHKYATFPSIAELREAAAETERGRVKQLSAAEAWALAWGAVKRTDPEIEGSFERATKGLPPLVVKAIRVIGICSLCSSYEPVGVLRGQFLKVFDQLAAAEKAAAVLPEATRKAIEGRTPAESPRALPAPVAAALLGVGAGGAP